MTEEKKADELYNYARVLHGTEKAKEEALNTAKATHALAPFRDGRMKAKSYWERVIEYLKKK
jgi:hypothetical protein